MINKLYSACYADNGYPFDVLLSNRDSHDVRTVVSADQIDDDKNAALIIWGGADINPQLYGHPESTRTYPGGKRDFIEWALLQRAIEVGIPIIGVCRGAQMACAAAGGYLLQHVQNHSGSNHDVTTPDGKVIKVNSIHHQMMVAEKVDHELLAWSTHRQSEEYIYKDDKLFEIPQGWKEPEFYYFPKIKAFAIQWHPEGMRRDSEATQYVLEKIRERI
jgi:putative glutamine amidotransferase